MASSQGAMQWGLHGPRANAGGRLCFRVRRPRLGSRPVAHWGCGCRDRAGGTDSLLDPLVYQSLARTHAFAYAPTATLALRPFDVERTGFVMGEGAAVLVLDARDVRSLYSSRIRIDEFSRGFGMFSVPILVPRLDKTFAFLYRQ